MWTGVVILLRLETYTPPETLFFLGPISRLIQRHMTWFMKDMLVAFFAIGLSGLIWRPYTTEKFHALLVIGLAIAYALLLNLCGAILSVNHIDWYKATFNDLFDLLPVWTMASLGIVLVNSVLNILPPGLILSALAISLMGFVFIRFQNRMFRIFLSRTTRKRKNAGVARERVLIVGSGRTAEYIAWMLDHPTYVCKFQVVGFLEDNIMTQGTRIYGARVIGRLRDIQTIIAEKDIGLVLLADHRLNSHECYQICKECSSASVKVAVVPDIFGSINDLLEMPISSEPIEEGTKIGLPCMHCLANHIGIKKNEETHA